MFETIQLLLTFAFLFGVPVAAAAYPPGRPLSFWQALSQAVITAAVILSLMALNYLLARLFLRMNKAETVGRPGSR